MTSIWIPNAAKMACLAHVLGYPVMFGSLLVQDRAAYTTASQYFVDFPDIAKGLVLLDSTIHTLESTVLVGPDLRCRLLRHMGFCATPKHENNRGTSTLAVRALSTLSAAESVHTIECYQVRPRDRRVTHCRYQYGTRNVDCP